MDISWIRWTALAILAAFGGYTVYCTLTENFWKSCRKVFALKWGRQVTADLYIGLLLFTFFIYMNEGTIGTTILWLIPTLVLGNIVPLLYFVIYFDAIVARFL